MRVLEGVVRILSNKVLESLEALARRSSEAAAPMNDRSAKLELARLLLWPRFFLRRVRVRCLVDRCAFSLTV